MRAVTIQGRLLLLFSVKSPLSVFSLKMYVSLVNSDPAAVSIQGRFVFQFPWYFLAAVTIQGRFIFQFPWYFLAVVTIQERFIFKGGF